MIKILESIDKYNIGDVVYLVDDYFKRTTYANGHMFLIMKKEDGKYKGIEITSKSKGAYDSNAKFTEKDIPEIRSGFVKLDNIAWFEDDDITRKKGQATTPFIKSIIYGFERHNKKGKDNREFLEALQLLKNMLKERNEMHD